MITINDLLMGLIQGRWPLTSIKYSNFPQSRGVRVGP